MNSKTIEYFVIVARFGSISRAALELGVEQSTVTRHISRLETDVGVRLFHRSGRGVILTDAGRQLLTRAQDVLHALERAKHTASTLAGTGPSQVVIAAQPTIAWLMFGGLADVLTRRFPGVQLHFREGLGHQMVDWLVGGEIDLAILYVPLQAHVVNFDVLLHEPLYCIAKAGFGLPENGLDVGSLLSYPMVLPSTQHGLRGLMQSLAHQENRHLDIAIECDGSIAVTKRLVEAGHGCTVLSPAAVMRERELGVLQAVPINDDRLLRTVAVATSKNRPMVDANWEINQLVRHVVSDLVASGAWPGVDSMASLAPSALS